jgi:hypothetical protein
LMVLQKYINRRKQIIPFWMTTEQPVTLPVGQTADVVALVGDDGHFEASHIMRVSDGPFSLELTDPDRKMNYMNGAVSDMAAIGDARYPQKFSVPLLLEQGRRLRFRITNTHTAPNSIYLTLRGRRIRAPLTEIENVKKALEVSI